MAAPSRAATPPSRRRSPWFWLVLALVAHAELLLLLGGGFYVFAPRDADIQRDLANKSGESIDVSTLDDETARKILAELDDEAEKAKEEQAKKEVDSTKAPGQVIDLPKPLEERRPDDARFAGEYDSTVAKETHKLGKFDEHARQGTNVGETQDVKHAAPPSPPDGRLAMRTPDLGRVMRAAGPPAPRAEAHAAGSSYGVAEPGEIAPDGSIARLGKAEPPQPTGGGLPAGGRPALTPTIEQLARVVGGSTQDALQDVDEGEETALNSKKWRFASFFNRVKKQVSEHWHPEEAYRRRDPTGAVYGRQNRYTELRITLKPDGRLANVGVNLPSGLEFLDDEAISAFKDAQPFPNPPRQLLENDGNIKFSFGFLYDLNGPPQMRWFKYNN
ncbi:MAG TPA: TonB family protein [Polyangia bacterium]|nr:TonB family protein [Polyangia bacterium]